MIVADTNLIVGLYTDSSQRELVMAVYKKDHEWAAPFLWRSEFRNVMALYLRKELLDIEQTIQMTGWAEQQMAMNEFTPRTSRVLTLVSLSGCSACDCEFVSVAEDLRCQLVTFDKKVLRQFPSVAVSPEEFIVR